jgi:hypothetical protein
VSEGEAAVFRFRGTELTVRETASGWHVRWGDREAESPYLDHAVAEVLGWHQSGVLGIVRQILTSDPGTDLSI